MCFQAKLLEKKNERLSIESEGRLPDHEHSALQFDDPSQKDCNCSKSRLQHSKRSNAINDELITPTTIPRRSVLKNKLFPHISIHVNVTRNGDTFCLLPQISSSVRWFVLPSIPRLPPGQ